MTTPAGWYDDGSGRLRWWDGQQWTEHFAPEPATEHEPAAATDTAPATDTTPATDTAPATDATPATDAAPATDVTPATDAATTADTTPATDTESVAAPEPAQDWATPGAHEASTTTPLAPPVGDHAFSGTPAEAQPFASPASTTEQAAYPPQPPYSAPTPSAGQPYPGQQQSAYPGQAAYPGQTAYPGQGGYPAAGPYPTAAAAEPKKLSVVGLVGLGLAALGTILAFIPVINVLGWLLLFAGFVVSIVSLFLKGKKWPGITGLVISVVGTIIAIVMSLVFFGFLVASQVDRPISLPSSSTDDSGTDDTGTGTDDGSGTGEVAEGTMGEPVTIAQMSGTGELTITSASWGTSNGSDFEATNGGYLVIDLTWETLDGTTYVNPLYFSVETAEGTEGDYDIFGDATLEAGELTAGQTTQGTVSFDVAQSGSYVVVVTDELLQEVARVTVEATAR